MTPEVLRAAANMLIHYIDMLASVRGKSPIDARVMGYAFRDWLEGDCDSGSGVPLSDLETRLSKCIENLARPFDDPEGESGNP